MKNRFQYLLGFTGITLVFMLACKTDENKKEFYEQYFPTPSYTVAIKSFKEAKFKRVLIVKEKDHKEIELKLPSVPQRINSVKGDSIFIDLFISSKEKLRPDTSRIDGDFIVIMKYINIIGVLRADEVSIDSAILDDSQVTFFAKKTKVFQDSIHKIQFDGENFYVLNIADSVMHFKQFNINSKLISDRFWIK